MYKYVRHPMYFWLQALTLLTPVMSFDRLVYFLATTIFLIIALPWEEEKLILEFGDNYLRYRSNVPMIFPFIPIGLHPAPKVEAKKD
jgi:protein-S-isoprenylcysteine O-methyltransferase Ste14